MTSAPIPEATPDPTAQERVEWLGKNSKRLIIALIVLIIAGLIVAFSFSLFSSSSANPGNMVASGVMTIDNDKEGAAILEVENLLPGESGEGTVSVTNVGDASGDFTLTASNLVSGPADFASRLTLAITDGTTEFYNEPLSDIDTVALGTWAPDEEHTFTFTVTFDADAGNEFQGATSSVDFDWTATQNAD